MALNAVAADLEHSQVFQLPLPKPTAKSVSISEADANTIETWLMGDLRNVIFGVGSIFPSRRKVVLAQPSAKVELAKIVARQDLPPRLRVYAQEILVEAGQAADPTLIEVYCQTMQSVEGRLYYDVWGLPSEGAFAFGRTLVGYGQAALPCLSHLLDNNNELLYGSSEWRAISDMYRHYRVSDLAAYFITQILHIHYNDDPNPAVRDQSIQALRQRLATSLQGASEAQSSSTKPKQ